MNKILVEKRMRPTWLCSKRGRENKQPTRYVVDLAADLRKDDDRKKNWRAALTTNAERIYGLDSRSDERKISQSHRG